MLFSLFVSSYVPRVLPKFNLSVTKFVTLMELSTTKCVGKKIKCLFTLLDGIMSQMEPGNTKHTGQKKTQHWQKNWQQHEKEQREAEDLNSGDTSEEHSWTKSNKWTKGSKTEHNTRKLRDHQSKTGNTFCIHTSHTTCCN